MQINNKIVAIFISGGIISLMCLIAYNVHLRGQQKEEALYELDFENTQATPDKAEDPQPDQESANQIHTSKAYNTAIKSKYAKEANNFQTLEELVKAKSQLKGNSASNTSQSNTDDQTQQNEDGNSEELLTSDNSLNSAYFAQKLQQQRKELERGNTDVKQTVQGFNTVKKSRVYYTLANRVHTFLPNPIYTCETKGKIVIDIKVDASGNVIASDYNKKKSSSNNGCLIDSALKYANQTKFNPADANSEKGTITYLFQGD
ncbi:hypothetical protein ACG2LH_01285 [Zhouia sp. PK063]|uniref:hypothetical protein n=1 Tax=Zhouia sp. PK063 TaxID=3373602 RepID=UPI0037BBF881